MRIAVIDGQGGGMGKAIVEKLRASFGSSIKILALGTNAVAVSLMIKAGADEGASGENAIRFNASKVDFIMGSIAILAPHAMLGEFTPRMSEAIGRSSAKKVLLPVNRCGLYIAGTKKETLPYYIDDAIDILRELSQKAE